MCAVNCFKHFASTRRSWKQYSCARHNQQWLQIVTSPEIHLKSKTFWQPAFGHFDHNCRVGVVHPKWLSLRFRAAKPRAMRPLVTESRDQGRGGGVKPGMYLCLNFAKAASLPFARKTLTHEKYGRLLCHVILQHGRRMSEQKRERHVFIPFKCEETGLCIQVRDRNCYRHSPTKRIVRMKQYWIFLGGNLIVTFRPDVFLFSN